jgi:hypothetical protein
MALHRHLGITTIATARPSAADSIYSVVGVVIGCLCLVVWQHCILEVIV